MQDALKKAVSLIFLCASAVVWLFLQRFFIFIWVILGLKFGRDWTVPLPQLVAIVLAAALFFFLMRNVKARDFIEGVIVELSKVAWPGRKETIMSTGVVSVLVAICAMILFLFDMIWGALVKVFYQ